MYLRGDCMIDEILKVLPKYISNEIIRLNCTQSITEIRLRARNKVILRCISNEIILDCIVTTNAILEILLNISKNSIYAIQNDINNGFVIIRGGHRIGISGEVVYVDGKIKNIKNICSLNIRVSRQIYGCADSVLPSIIQRGRIQNTLIVSPPGCGKTTLIRDIVRQISNGVPNLNLKGKNVSLIDERGEIASVYEGVASLDVGTRTDVMSNVTKATGMKMMIRSMAPDVIATDEIGKSEDIVAIKEAILSGVSVIFTMHGDSIKSIVRNKEIKELLDLNIFSKIIILSNGKIPGIVEKIYDTEKLGGVA